MPLIYYMYVHTWLMYSFMFYLVENKEGKEEMCRARLLPFSSRANCLPRFDLNLGRFLVSSFSRLFFAEWMIDDCWLVMPSPVHTPPYTYKYPAPYMYVHSICISEKCCCVFINVIVFLSFPPARDTESRDVRSFDRMPHFIHYCHMYRVGQWLFNKR